VLSLKKLLRKKSPSELIIYPPVQTITGGEDRRVHVFRRGDGKFTFTFDVRSLERGEPAWVPRQFGGIYADQATAATEGQAVMKGFAAPNW
jgi:hypothetical protein